jgi:hypothetical protein
MKTKYTTEQKRRLKILRDILKRQKKYTPMGQGDGMNQELNFKEICGEIEQTKADPDFVSRKILF